MDKHKSVFFYITTIMVLQGKNVNQFYYKNFNILEFYSHATLQLEITLDKKIYVLLS